MGRGIWGVEYLGIGLRPGREIQAFDHELVEGPWVKLERPGAFRQRYDRVRGGERVIGGSQWYAGGDSVAGHRAGDALWRSGDVEAQVVADEQSD